ncbi:MAG: GAF domain-containing protein, partial [Chloroflexota bacterium]|nr:GAF domain-containing protein [Chloroflexota bacterium]
MAEIDPATRPTTSSRLGDVADISGRRKSASVANPALDRLARLAAHVLDVPVALVSLVEQDRQVFPGCIGLRDPWGSRRETPISHSFCKHVVASQTSLVIEDARKNPLVIDNPAIQDLGVVAYAGMPLAAPEGQVLGSFCAIDSQPRTWTERDLDILREFAAAAATEIELDRQVRSTEAAKEMLAAVNQVGRTLNADLDLDRIVETVTEAATELTGAAFGALFYNVTDERGDSYALYKLAGAPKEAFADFPLPRSTPIFGPTFRGEGPVRLDDVRTDPRYGQLAPHYGLPPGHLPVASYLAVPIVTRSGEVLGGLFFGHPDTGVFDEEAEELAKGLAAHAAIAIENARLFERAQIAEARYRA